MGNKLLTRECPSCFVFPFEKQANFCRKFQIFPVEGVKRHLAPSECLCLIRVTAAGGYTEPESTRSISSRPASALMMPCSWAVTEGRLTQHPPAQALPRVLVLAHGLAERRMSISFGEPLCPSIMQTLYYRNGAVKLDVY